MTPAALPSTLVPLILAPLALGISIAFNNGAYDEKAIVFLLMGLLFLGWGYASLFSASSLARKTPDGLFAPLFWIALVSLLFWGWNDQGLIMYAQAPWALGRSAMQWMLLVLFTYLPAMFGLVREPRWLRLLRFGIFATLVLLAGADVLRASPRPWIDVWTVQQQGAEALLHGQNPYTHTAAVDTTPGRVGNDTPYVYPPTQVLVGVLPFALAHDVRYAMLLALLVAGISLRFITARSGSKSLPAMIEDGPALLIWCSPKAFFILEQAWVDPVQLMFLAAGCALFIYGKKVPSAVVLGIAASSKQTLFWVVPLAGFCLGFDRKQWAWFLASAAAPVVPFLIWDFRAIKHANFDFLAHIPPRPDALTLGNWLNRKYHLGLEGALAFPLSFAVVALAVWKMRSVLAFAAALALTYVVFFAFNKQAFANYYFFVGGLSALAAACAISAFASTTSSSGQEPASSSVGLNEAL